MENRTIRYVKVKNNNDFPLKDRFDGIPFTFGAGKTETIPADAAAHFFGIVDGADPEEIHNHICRRYGWNHPKYMENGSDRNRTSKIILTPVSAKLVMEHTEEAPVSMTPLLENEIPVRPGAGKKALQAASLAAAVGE